MKTHLEFLIELHPNLKYDDGCFFLSQEDWEMDYPLTVSPESHAVLNADLIIEDHYSDRSIPSNPDERNPEWQETKEVSGREYIEYHFKNYSDAFNHAKL